ncbi:hypothetical protein DIPPA_04909 [Diplonema papillatum]|nr:hypothetical protein DIPPA_04909 [Diplonema papillatum]
MIGAEGRLDTQHCRIASTAPRGNKGITYARLSPNAKGKSLPGGAFEDLDLAGRAAGFQRPAPRILAPAPPSRHTVSCGSSRKAASRDEKRPRLPTKATLDEQFESQFAAEEAKSSSCQSATDVATAGTPDDRPRSTDQPPRVIPTQAGAGASHSQNVSASFAQTSKLYDPWPVREVSPRLRHAESTWGSQPELLRQMESFLDTELTLLRTAGLSAAARCRSECSRTTVGPSPDGTDPPAHPAAEVGAKKGMWREVVEAVDIPVTRVFLTAFRIFINSSRLYGPVLDAVYRRLEAVVDAYASVYRGSSEMTRKTEALQRDCEAKLETQEERHEAKRAEWAEATEELQAMLEEKEREVEDVRSQATDLRKIEKMYTDKWYEEREKVLTMVSQIRDAEEQHQETMIQYEQLRRETMGVADLTKLYQKTADELQTLKDDYAETVPAKQFDLLQRLLKEKTDKILQMKLTFASLRKRMEGQEKVVKRQVQTIEQLEADCRRLRDSKGRDTPRPEWETLVQEGDLGITLEPGMSSQHIGESLSDMLVKERSRTTALEKDIAFLRERLSFLGGDGEADGERESTGETEFFVGLGTGKDIPKYLRWFGQVKNRDLPKREVEHFVQDFWTARKKDNERHQKLLEDAVKKRVKMTFQQENLEDYMFSFLKGKHGAVQARIVDKGYNIKYACKKFSYDGDCELFLLILEGTLPEVIYYEQMKMLDKLQKKLEELELPGPTGKRSGKVKRSRILPLLDKFFASKSEKNLVRLKYELSKQMPGEEVSVAALFAEDREGNQGPFVEAVRSQMVKETLAYYQLLSNAIFMKADPPSDDDEGEETSIRLGSIRDAILEADPQKSAKDVDRMLCLGLGAQDGVVHDMARTVALEPFLTKLKQSYLYRHTKPVD